MSETLAEFAKLCESYIGLVDSHENYDLYTFSMQVSLILGELYTAATRLPELYFYDEEAEDEALEDLDANNNNASGEHSEHHKEWQKLYSKLGPYFGNFDTFILQFNPFEATDTKPVGGQFSDMLADIYLDLKDGLCLYESGAIEDAIWDWKFNFKEHWGLHLAEIIYPMHWLVYQILDPEKVEDSLDKQ